ncbi:methyl-accepting chemotaxis protein [Bosea psychrotolerans]|uniref:Methyl-accepting chemotaxis protein n=1 Tax=Bosea psychrotolerans TaxID=1871628 RepID=A0A2S4M887_9HYPH|nr:HAMP domain-containing methyl-accepting chemotaxis protein [Bosea psychrotolerans]POR50835.1 methyl-accepting chemotaxis protein [Bosea psychrotolerans]
MILNTRRFSILLCVLSSFAVVIALIGASAYLVKNLTTKLIAETRDAVWEASVPAEYVYMTVSDRWNGHRRTIANLNKDHLASATSGRSVEQSTGWRELLNLSVDFPIDIKAAIDRANDKLKAFDAAKDRTDELVRLQQIRDAAENLYGSQTEALDAFSEEAASLLKTMAARIGEVNRRMEQTAEMTLAWLAQIGTALLVLVSSITILLQIGIINPIRRMNHVMQRLASGDYGVDAPKVSRLVEIGQMGATIGVFRASLVEREKLRRQQDEQRNIVETERREFLRRLALAFESKVGVIVQSVIEAARGLHTAADRMSRETASATAQAEAVAAAAQDANANVRTVADAAGSLFASMRGVGSQIRTSGDRIRYTVDQAAKANIDIQALDTAALSIGSVAEVINAFAVQTNLLSLNATIEAARAGDAGRGFGVVAQEVKSLALKTAGATSQIAERIAAIQSASSATIESIHSMSHSIDEMAGIASSASDAIAQQIETTCLIATNVNEAALKTASVTRTIGEASVAIQTAGNLVARVLDAARDLNRDGEILAKETQQFADIIRAA